MIKSRHLKVAIITITALSLSACFDDDDDDEEMVNNPPQALSISLVTEAETNIMADLPASDPDNDPLTFSIVLEPSFGTLALNTDGSYTYSPMAEFTGMDSFTYAITDGRPPNTSFEGTVDIRVDELPVSFLTQSRLAFGQNSDNTPIVVNGRAFTQDVSGESDYQDLIDAN